MDFDVKCEYQMQNLKTQVLNHCDDDETSCVKEETHQCAKGVLCFTSFVTNQEWNPEFPWNVGKSTYTVLTSKDGIETVEMWISNAKSENTSFEPLWWWREISCHRRNPPICQGGSVLHVLRNQSGMEPRISMECWQIYLSSSIWVCYRNGKFRLWPIYSRSLW